MDEDNFIATRGHSIITRLLVWPKSCSHLYFIFSIADLATCDRLKSILAQWTLASHKCPSKDRRFGVVLTVSFLCHQVEVTMATFSSYWSWRGSCSVWPTSPLSSPWSPTGWGYCPRRPVLRWDISQEKEQKEPSILSLMLHHLFFSLTLNRWRSWELMPLTGPRTSRTCPRTSASRTPWSSTTPFSCSAGAGNAASAAASGEAPRSPWVTGLVERPPTGTYPTAGQASPALWASWRPTRPWRGWAQSRCCRQTPPE